MKNDKKNRRYNGLAVGLAWITISILSMMLMLIIVLAGMTVDAADVADAHTERTLEIHCDDYGYFQYSVIVEDGWYLVELVEPEQEYGIDDGFVSIDESEELVDEWGNRYVLDNGTVEVLE